MNHLIFIGGGARSGKSSWAVRRALEHPPPRRFLATAHAFDDEMRARIALHKDERRDDFITVDAPYSLSDAITACPPGSVILIDCLTLWLSNMMLDETQSRDIAAETATWLDAAKGHAGTVIVVANEVGQGIVPMNALSRAFRDEAGRLNQRVAQAADEVYVSFFGLVLALKTQPSDSRP